MNGSNDFGSRLDRPRCTARSGRVRARMCPQLGRDVYVHRGVHGSVRYVHAWYRGIHGSVTDMRAWFGARTRACAYFGLRLDWPRRTARSGRVRARRCPLLDRDVCMDKGVHVLVKDARVCACLVATHVRITHGLNFMDDGIMWTNYTNSHMQLKVKVKQLKKEAMQLKVKAKQLKKEAMQLKIKAKQLKMEAMQLKVDACKGTWEAMINKELRICSTLFFSLVCFSLLLSPIPWGGKE